ncbi:MAG: sortase [Rhodocyclaceae bacterium]
MKVQRYDWPLGVECAWPTTQRIALAKPCRSAFRPKRPTGISSGHRAEARPAARRRWQLWLAAIAFSVSLWQLGQGSYIQAKAWLAQVLIKQAWARTLEGEAQARPWPWADTWPVARITVPGRDIERYVLAGANGRTIAFGPGHVFGTPLPGEAGNSVIGAHRDTHFAFLRALRPGEEIVVENASALRRRLMPAEQALHRNQKSAAATRRYRVSGAEIVDKSETRVLAQPPGETRLTLVTCYPFDALRAGGPLRYVVTAKAI